MASTASTASRSKLSRIDWMLVLLASLAALAVRILPFADDVFQPYGVVAWKCPDVYYHLHRIELWAGTWPALPELDRWRNYPDGAYSIWTPLFDVVPAAFSAVTSAPPMLVGVLWPALLGALALVPLFSILHRLYGRAAWLGVALFVVLPGAVSFSLLSRADHHVGEVVMQLWVYALALRAFDALERGEPLRLRDAIWLGVASGLSLWMWRGAVVILAVPAGAAFIAVATTRDELKRSATARFFQWALSIAALVTLPYAVLNAARGRPAFAAYFLSLLQPCMLLVWALLLSVAEQLGATGLRVRPLLRARVLLPLIGALVLIALGAHGFVAGTAFLTRVGDDWAATITESQPLWAGGLATHFVIEQLGFVPWLLPALILVELVKLLRRRPPSPIAVCVLLITACVTALVFMQVRFVYYAAPVVAALPCALWCALRARPIARAAALAGALLLLWPVHRFWWPVFDGDPRSQMHPLGMEPWQMQLLAELHNSTPSAGDIRRVDAQPDYCVLAPWDLGNFIEIVAQRPVLASSGGPHETASYADTVQFESVFTAESEAVERMTQHGCRYAITERANALTDPEGRGTQLFAQRLHVYDGSDRDALSGSGRFRYRFESHDAGNGALARYKVFELVPGALLRFPGSTQAVLVQTEVGDQHRRITYQRRLQPDADGTAVVRVSQPGNYRVLDAHDAVLGVVPVSEDAVTQGHKLMLAPTREELQAHAAQLGQ